MLFRSPTGLPIDALEGAIAWGFCDDGERILVAMPQRLEAFDARTGFRLAGLAASGIVSADVNPARAEIAYSRGREIAIWNATQARSTRSRPTSTFVSSVRFSRDGSKLLTLSVDGNVRILDAATLSDEGVALRHSFAVVRAAFAPDARWVVTTALDGVVRIWDYSTGQVIATASQPPDAVGSRALLLGNDNWLALVDAEGAVRWTPVAIGFPRPLPEWFGRVFASLSGLAAIDEGPAPAARKERPRPPEWTAWWQAWRAYVSNRKLNPGES